jgi:hypothetical protein
MACLPCNHEGDSIFDPPVFPGEYSADRLRELKLKSVGKSSEGGEGGNVPLIKLSGSFKVSTAKDDRYEMGSSIAVVSEND